MFYGDIHVDIDKVAYDIFPPFGKWRPDIHQVRLTGYAVKHKKHIFNAGHNINDI